MEIKNANLDGEDDKFESEDLNSINSKALFIIRKLRDYGWINIDFNAKNSFEEYIAFFSTGNLCVIYDSFVWFRN